MTNRRPDGVKLCKICEKEKRYGPTSSYCRGCANAYYLKYKKTPKQIAYRTQYIIDTRQLVLDRGKRYRAKNRAKLRARNKVYRDNK